VAGKTGTTTSNKDGWFLGFSSGITTGVWMGRDNATPVPGLQGGTAPARAFHDFMVKAVARRPAEAFDTKVVLPDWQLEPEDDAYVGDAPETMMVDEAGNPVYAEGNSPAYGESPQATVTTQVETPNDVDRLWLDQVRDRNRDADRPRPRPILERPTPALPRERALPEPAPPPEEVKFRPVPS
jgi:penicillin-binding protein 1A